MKVGYDGIEELFTPRLGLICFDAFNLLMRKNQVAALQTEDESSETIQIQLFKKYREHFQYNKTIDGVKI